MAAGRHNNDHADPATSADNTALFSEKPGAVSQARSAMRVVAQIIPIWTRPVPVVEQQPTVPNGGDARAYDFPG